jgi:surface antigen
LIQLKINETQYQIDVANAQISETNDQITKAEADLAHQKEIMNEYIKTMYMESQTTTVELIARSNSFSEFVDQSEYLSTMQEKVQETANKISKLKEELEAKKKDLEITKAKAESLRASQVAERSSVATQQSYKNSLLSNAAASEANLKKQRTDLYAEKTRLSQAFNETILRGSTSYPYGNPPATSIIDTPDDFGYLIGECTSYSAWKRAAMGRPVPRNLGNANTWGSRAASQGLSVDSDPAAGDVMVFPYLGYYGHVAIVDSVNSDGTVNISEYNWVPYSFTQRTVNPYNYSAVFIH